MDKNIADRAIMDPKKMYAGPQAVLDDERLSADDKLRVLENWEQDQVALLRAEGENMTADKNGEAAANLLKKIKQAEEKIKQESR